MDTLLSTVRSQPCRSGLKCFVWGKDPALTLPHVCLLWQGTAHRKSLKLLMVCNLFSRSGCFLCSSWSGDADGSLEQPACSQPHPLCKQRHSVGQAPCQQNRIQRFCAPICQLGLLCVFLLEKELQLMWSSGLQLKGCVLVSTTHLFARSVWVNAASMLVWAHPSGFDRAHVSETRRIWVPVNYDSWHLIWNKDQIWDGFLPSCCI